jgi:hypothetical protein
MKNMDDNISGWKNQMEEQNKMNENLKWMKT